MAFLEAQRAGPKPSDADSVPQVGATNLDCLYPLRMKYVLHVLHMRRSCQGMSRAQWLDGGIDAAVAAHVRSVLLTESALPEQPPSRCAVYRDEPDRAQVWGWKEPAFTDVCSTFLSQQGISAAAASELQQHPGYFEAGGAVITTMPAAFTAAQQALGVLHFEGALEGLTVGTPIAGDAAGCLPSAYTRSSVLEHVRRQLRCAASGPVYACSAGPPAMLCAYRAARVQLEA